MSGEKELEPLDVELSIDTEEMKKWKLEIRLVHYF